MYMYMSVVLYMYSTAWLTDDHFGMLQRVAIALNQVLAQGILNFLDLSCVSARSDAYLLHVCSRSGIYTIAQLSSFYN